MLVHSNIYCGGQSYMQNGYHWNLPERWDTEADKRRIGDREDTKRKTCEQRNGMKHSKHACEYSNKIVVKINFRCLYDFYDYYDIDKDICCQ